ncbi:MULTISPECIES: Nif11-like leader peptide family RiPP precursor [Nostoc]|uniref:Nif11-like leader peptide family natural product n=1 Tax=Nostoc paludosum FACHB-159 TaxID=2692908 RepID=A0ABR8K867_9NOSO|nr:MULTISPECIES: Nif11-like leader peptide family RiPP precursor [Nostoc]MBD2679304.1 Nif11-like leader peptide family natural product precursor [Nostoc sp. FACHB-857]MBD2735688.1 Nif11-like leader peptide family natural product precursor [Nostoc paludosum FACHB-159]
MLHQIKELLQNAQLQQQVQAAANQAEAIKLLAIASAEKGYNFTVESLSQMLAELTVDSNELSEEELLSVSGGMMADTGHGHMSCCTDCPKGNGQC